jgi:hypothetical protein
MTLRLYFSKDPTRPAKAQVVSRRHLTAEACVRVRVISCRIYGGLSDTGQVHLRVLRLSPVNTIPPLLPTLISGR